MRWIVPVLAALTWIGVAQAQTPGASEEKVPTISNGPLRDPAEVLERLRFTPYAPADAPASVATGTVARGDRLVTIQLRHVRTGTLRGDGAARSMAGQLDGMTLRSGTPVFLTATIDGRRAWCGRAVANDWRGNCLIVNPQTRAPTWLAIVGWDNESIYFPRTYTGSHPLAEPLPVIEEGPVDFGVAMEMVWTFDRWTRQGAQIKREVRDSAGRRTKLPALRAELVEGGAARVEIAGGALLLRRSGDGAAVEVIDPIDSRSAAARTAVNG